MTTLTTASVPLSIDLLLDDVAAAADTLHGVARLTPLQSSAALSDLVGGPAFVKCENLQRTGSFKIRGAYTRIARLDPSIRARGVVAASAGNHAQGVALAARMLGTSATIFMPTIASLPKVDATRSYGADVVLTGHSVDECITTAQQYAADAGATFVHPFDHPDVIAGQATVTAEILTQRPDIKTVLCPVGGGGLLAGAHLALRERRSAVRIVGVQAESSPGFINALRKGTGSTTPPHTIADGIAVAKPGELPVSIVRADDHEIRTVGEHEIAQAVVYAFERLKLTVEPAGAVGLAAVLARPAAFPPPVAIILSGGNVDPLVMLRLIRHGLATSGRFLTLSVRIADRAGELAALLRDLAGVGGNVLEVNHSRENADLAPDEVDVSLVLEARGADHATEITECLAVKCRRVIRAV